jgi:hypothetical protein
MSRSRAGPDPGPRLEAIRGVPAAGTHIVVFGEPAVARRAVAALQTLAAGTRRAARYPPSDAVMASRPVRTPC